MKTLKLTTLMYVYAAAIIICFVALIFAGNDINTTGVVAADITLVNGKPIQLVLSVIDDDNYQYYWINNKGKGLQLYDYIGRRVTVSGRVWKDSTGRQRITIKKILKIWGLEP